MNFMKTTSTLELMKLERYRARRRTRRGWKRRLGIWLWVIVAALVLALVGAARAAAGFTPPRLEGRGDEALELGGFGASDAVAVGIVLLVIVGLLVRLWWAESADQEVVSTYSDEQWDPYAGDGRGGSEPEPWMVRLRAFFAARGVLITDAQAVEMRVVCVPEHPLGLVWLDAFLRRELGLRLFMTSLLEVQEICAVGRLAPMIRDGLKPELQTQASESLTVEVMP